MHSQQRGLLPEIEGVWLAALEDAAIEASDALLYALDGESGSSGEGARYLYRGMKIVADQEAEEIHLLLDEMNGDDCIGAYRVVVFTDRTIEGIAALLRHELEHGRQRDLFGQNLMELDGMAKSVISERVGGLCGGGFFYQVIPTEMDANAAAAQFVRGRFGADRMDELLRLGDKDGAAFRSLVGPPAIETLPERMIQFLATIPDLCQRYADRTPFEFPTLLDVLWRGAGAIWSRLVDDDALKLPR